MTKAVVRFEDDGTVEVRHGWTEMGQGVHTVAAQVAIEELGVDPARVRVVVDTHARARVRPDHGEPGHARWARARWPTPAGSAQEADCAVGVDYVGEYRVDWTNKLDEGLEHPVIHSTFGYAAQLVVIDRDTGAIERVVAAHDVGRAVNPLLCDGQIEGSVHMGLGYALTEDFPSDADGRPHGRHAARARHHPGQGRAADRRDPGGGAAAERARTASRAWARSGSCRPPERWPPRSTTSTASWRTQLPMRRGRP